MSDPAPKPDFIPAVELDALRASLAAANARCERMRKALEPFASLVPFIVDGQSDEQKIRHAKFYERRGLNDAPRLTLGDLRAARDASGETGEGRG